MGLLKALLVNTEETPPIPVPVMFNPPEYTMRKASNFTKVDKPLQGESEYQFISSDKQELSMELFFDTTDLGVDVRVFTSKIYKMIQIPDKKSEPPLLMFIWGPLIFECRMTSFSQKFEYFDNQGQALRARVNITLVGRDMAQDNMKKAPAMRGAQVNSAVVKMGQTVHSIAAATLGDPKKWRTIAKENKLANPFKLQPGKTLRIPG